MRVKEIPALQGFSSEYDCRGNIYIIFTYLYYRGIINRSSIFDLIQRAFTLTWGRKWLRYDKRGVRSFSRYNAVFTGGDYESRRDYRLGRYEGVLWAN